MLQPYLDAAGAAGNAIMELYNYAMSFVMRNTATSWRRCSPLT